MYYKYIYIYIYYLIKDKKSEKIEFAIEIYMKILIEEFYEINIKKYI